MDVTIKYKGGASFTSHRPVFSSNGEIILVASKNVIYEYNTITGKKLHEYKGLKDDVIGFGCNNIDSLNCVVACSKKGQVIVWNTHFKTLEAQLPQVQKRKLKTFHLIPSNGGELLALITYSHKVHIRIAVWDIKKKIIKRFKLQLQNEKYYIDVSANNYFSATQNNKVYFAKLNTFDEHSKTNIEKNNRNFTCIACHSSEEVVLTGDNTGRVLLWQNIFGEKPSYSVFHWHTLPVNCVGFSHSGTYFYSGADECVLVKWHLDTPHENSFLPRIPAGIKHVVVAENNALVAILTADNGLRILDSQLNQVGLIQHLVLGQHLDTGMLYDSKTKALVMNGNVGCVQFYSPNDSTLLYNVDIVQQNKITNERNLNIENVEVRKVALSKGGDWMGTVEERKDPDYGGEIRLKFWHFNTEKQIFELNTSIESPHKYTITDFAFQPLSENVKCVTVAEDKTFKIWQVTETTTIYKKGFVWKCLATGFYRDYFCKGLSFSADGSLFATGFEKILTTWSPDSCELKCSLVHPNHGQKIKLVQFGCGNQCHLLVAASDYQLCVWNLLTLSLVWVVQLNRISILEADRWSSYMFLITERNNLFVFEPASPKPVFQTDIELNKQHIVAASFMPSKYKNDSRFSWYEKSDIYFINSNNELYCITKNEDIVEYDDITEDKEPSGVFGKMLPASKSTNKKESLRKTHLFEKDMQHTSLKKYLEAPLQTMAPIRFTCNTLLKSFIWEKSNVNPQE